MGFVRQAIKQILTSCVPRERLIARGGRAAPHQLPRIALTFDDGPDPVNTSNLLDVMQSCQITGTFFVVGNQAQACPDLVRRIADEGHEIGNHTWSHSEPARTTPAEFLAEIQQTDQLIHELVGEVPRTVRPPKGELNWRKLQGLWRQKKTVALWNIDPRDYRMQSEHDVSAWCAGYRPCDGDVVLMHDNHQWAATAIRLLFDAGLFDRFQTVGISTLARGRDQRTTRTTSLRES